MQPSLGVVFGYRSADCFIGLSARFSAPSGPNQVWSRCKIGRIFGSTNGWREAVNTLPQVYPPTILN